VILGFVFLIYKRCTDVNQKKEGNVGEMQHRAGDFWVFSREQSGSFYFFSIYFLLVVRVDD
jgi:hypothetical protein